MWIFILVVAFLAPAEDLCSGGKIPDFNGNGYGQGAMKALQQYLIQSNNTVKRPEDFMCCLKEQYGANADFFFSPNSIAGQPGTYASPRAFMVIRDPATKEIRATFSVNGGEDNMNQKDNVEVQFNNPQTQELEMFDLAFTIGGGGHGGRMSGKNPQECMNCHAAGKEPPIVGGAKPIFDPNPWQRYSGKNPLGGACPNQSQLHQTLRDKGAEAMANNPRYKCMEPKTPTLGEMLNFDDQYQKLNDRRVAKIVKSTRDFSWMRYVVIAMEVCPHDDPGSHPEDILKWLPPTVLSKMTDTSTTAPAVSSGQPEGLADILEADRAADEVVRVTTERSAKAALDAIAQGKPVENYPPVGFGSCNGRKSASAGPGPGPKPLSPKEKVLEEINRGINSTHKKYITDMLALGQTENDDMRKMAALRFLFEGRGIDISDWNMRQEPGYERVPKLAGFLLKSEKDTDFLKVMTGAQDLPTVQKRREAICKNLKERIEKIGAVPQASSTAAPQILPPSTQER